MQARFLHVGDPPVGASRAGVGEQRPEREVGPRLARDHHQQKVASGFEDSRGFVDRLVAACTVDVVHGVGADYAIEAGIVERELQHIGGGDRRASVHSRGFEVIQELLLRRSRFPEMLFEGRTEQVGRDNCHMRACL